MTPLLAIPIFFAQGAALGADEFIFHRRRGLPRWERLGHPVDTFSVLLCLGATLILPVRQPWTGIYFGLALFSCLLVTKDEWVHTSLCPPAEHWLHALLFLLHPALLWAVYRLWSDGEAFSRQLLQGEAALCAVFMGYQILYWNFPWRRSPSR